MKKSTIAVDIDEVLLPHFKDLILWYNSNFGTKLTEQDNHPTSLANWGTDSMEVAVKRVHRFYLTSEFRDAKPFPEAVAVLKKLVNDYEIIVVTARDTPFEQLTNDWLADHFEELFNSIHFTRQYSLEGKRREKSEVLLEQSVDFFIDDSLDNINKAAALGIESLLFGNYAWNQAINLSENVTRCKDWGAVEEYFAERK